MNLHNIVEVNNGHVTLNPNTKNKRNKIR